MAFWPFVIKLLSYALIVLLDLEQNLTRQGLILLPATFAEGMLVAALIRFILFGEILDARSAASGGEVLRRALLGGTIVYVLIKMLITLVAALTMIDAASYPKADGQTPPPQEVLLTLLAVSAFLIWMFRYLWLYIPLLTGNQVKYFLNRMRPIKLSFKAIGISLLCFMPAAMLLLLSSALLGGIFPDTDAGPSVPYMLGMAAVQSATELLIAVVSSLAIALLWMDVRSKS